jgi:uncharacterized protein YtpQ (UPF0354 family)
MNARVQKAVAYLKPEVPRADSTAALQLTADDSPVLRAFATGLLTAYLVDDEGETFSYVQGRDLRDAGVRAEELHRQAVANLSELADGRVTVQQSGPVWALFFDGNFEASLMHLDDLWTHGLREYAGDPVVAIPARDVLAFCDAGSVGGVAELRAVVKRVWPTGDHLLSESLYRRVDGIWRVHTYGSQ